MSKHIRFDREIPDCIIKRRSSSQDLQSLRRASKLPKKRCLFHSTSCNFCIATYLISLEHVNPRPTSHPGLETTISLTELGVKPMQTHRTLRNWARNGRCVRIAKRFVQMWQFEMPVRIWILFSAEGSGRLRNPYSLATAGVTVSPHLLRAPSLALVQNNISEGLFQNGDSLRSYRTFQYRFLRLMTWDLWHYTGPSRRSHETLSFYIDKYT